MAGPNLRIDNYNIVHGSKTTASYKSNEVSKSSERIVSTKKLPFDDTVGYVIGNRLSDNTKFHLGLVKSVGNGVSLLQTAKNGLERIHKLLTSQKSNLASATGKNERALEVINSKIQASEGQINDIVRNTVFGNTKLLDGTFGVDKTRVIKYPDNFYSASIATKEAPAGPNVFLRDNIVFMPFEASSAIVTLNNVADNDSISIGNQKFVFRNNPHPLKKNEIQLQQSNEANARRLVTAILNSDNMELKRYAASNSGGGSLMIQSQIRSEKAANVSSTSPSIIVDNVSPQADPNVLDLDKLTDNEELYGKIFPHFKLSSAPVYGLDARNLALMNDIDLTGYAGDAGDSIAQYSCKIGDKEYSGVIFLRGSGGVVQNMSAAPAAPERLLLVMREINNENSSFAINFDPTYTGILDTQANAEAIGDNLNDLFARMTFKQNRYIGVNEIPDYRVARLFDPKTMTATITNTNFQDLEIESFNIDDVSPTLVAFRLTINGLEYIDSAVPKMLKEGDRVTMAVDTTNFVSLTVGKGGLNLSNPQQFYDIEQAMMTFFTNQDTYHEVQVTKQNYQSISTKIGNFTAEEIFKDRHGEYTKLNILEKHQRRKTETILSDATQRVMNQIIKIEQSINNIKSQEDRINSMIDITNNSYNSYTDTDFVKEGAALSKNLKDLLAVISVQDAARIIDACAQQMIYGLGNMGGGGNTENKAVSHEKSPEPKKSEPVAAAPAA